MEVKLCAGERSEPQESLSTGDSETVLRDERRAAKRDQGRGVVVVAREKQER